VFVARQGYHIGILRWSCNEVYITITRDNNCENHYSLFCFQLVIASA